MNYEMIERVARAIYASHAFNDNHDSLTSGFDGLSDEWKGVMMANARAAIEALRQPTDRMLNMGQHFYDKTSCGLMDIGPDSALHEAWDRMIDEALK